MSDEDLVSSIIARWVEARDRGEAADPEEVFRAHPDHADELRRRFAAMERLDRAVSEAPSPGRLRVLPTDRYRDYTPAGEGGMGIVYLAIDTDLNREVAFKVVRPDVCSGERVAAPDAPLELSLPDRDTPASLAFETLKARFLQEAWVTGGMSHPGIVPVYETGQTPEGVPYYTMRFVRGHRTLATAIEEAQTAPIEERLALLDPFLKVCDTIAYAHSKGVIHRDLKPENVAIGEYGEVVVLDWGLAKIADKEDVTGDLWRDRIREFRDATDLNTVAGAMGTPGFMAPEAAIGDVENVDGRSDVYSLGAMLYQLLTGALPHRFTTYADFIQVIRGEDPTPASEADPAVPAALSDLCANALSRVKDSRPESPAALARSIRAWQTESAMEREIRDLLAKAETAYEGTEGLVGASLLRQVDRVTAVCSRIEEVRPGHDRAAELAAGCEGLRGRALAESARAGRRRMLVRGGGLVLVLAVIVAVVVAGVIQGKRREAEQARESEREQRLAKEEALAAQTRALARAEGLRLAGLARHAEEDPALALRLALEGAKRHGSPVSRNTLFEALRANHEILTLAGHRDEVNRVRFSRNGNRLVTSCFTKTGDPVTRVWDLSTGRELARMAGYPATDEIAPDGRRVLLSEPHPSMVGFFWPGLRLRDADTGESVRLLKTDLTDSAWFSADGREVFALVGLPGEDRRRVRVFDAETGAVLRDPGPPLSAEEMLYTSIQPKDAYVRALTADRSVCLSRGHMSGAARLWRPETGETLWRCGPSDEHVESVDMDASAERVLVRTSGGTVRVFEVASDRMIAEIRDERGDIRDARLSPDGRTVATAHGSGVRLRKASGGKLLHTLPVPDATTVRFGPEGRHLATASEDGTIRVWDPVTGEKAADLLGHRGRINDIVFSPDGTRIASASDDRTVRVWRIAPWVGLDRSDLIEPKIGFDPATLEPASESGPVSARFDATGKWIVTAGSADRTVRVWDAATGEERLVLEAKAREDQGDRWKLLGARFLEDGLILAWDDVGAVWAWVFPSGTPGARGVEDTIGATGRGPLLIPETPRNHGVSFSPRVMVARGEPLDEARDIVVSPCGRYALGTNSEGSGARLLSLVIPGTIAAEVEEWNGEADLTAFSGDGSRLVSLNWRGEGGVWDTGTGRRLATFKADYPYPRLAVSPDGGRLLHLATIRSVCVRDAATGKLLSTLEGHAGLIYSARFDPIGARVLTSSHDGTARIWSAETGKLLHELRGHEGEVFSAEFDPAGERVVTVGWDGTFRVWDAGTGEELRAVRAQGGGEVESWSCSADGTRLATFTSGDRAEVRDTATGEVAATIAGGVVFGEHCDGGAKLVGLCPDGRFRVWDAAAGRLLHDLGGDEGYFENRDHTVRFGEGLHVSEDGRLAVGCLGAEPALVWDVRTGKETARIERERHPSSVSDLLGSRLLMMSARYSNATRRVRVLDIAAGTSTVLVESDDVLCAELSGDGSLAAIASRTPHDGTGPVTVEIHDLERGEVVTTFVLEPEPAEVPGDRDSCIRFDPADRRIFVCVSSFPRLFDARNGEALFTLRGHREPVRDAAFSADGDLFATLAGSEVWLWNAGDGSEVYHFEPPEDCRSGLLFRGEEGEPPVLRTYGGEMRGWPVDLVACAGSLRPRDFTPEEWDRLQLGPSDVDDDYRRQWEERTYARSAERLVDDLFHELARQSEVLARIRADETLSEDLREAALCIARGRHQWSASQLHALASTLAEKAGRTHRSYEAAANRMRAALRIHPGDSEYLAVLALALSRTGAHKEALRIVGSLERGDLPYAAASEALSLHHLDRAEEARVAADRFAGLAAGSDTEFNELLSELRRLIDSR